jgi:molybdopterin synthase catalytic subunit
MAAISVRIANEAIDADAEIAAFRSSCAASGGLAFFVGQVRADGGAATSLALEHYPGHTEREIEKLCETAARRWTLDALNVIHRVGEMSAGEAIVLVSAASPHRRAAFLAVDFLMDYLKSEAPLWKRESSGEGWRWVEPRAEDYTDKARWRKEGA